MNFIWNDIFSPWYQRDSFSKVNLAARLSRAMASQLNNRDLFEDFPKDEANRSADKDEESWKQFPAKKPSIDI